MMKSMLNNHSKFYLLVYLKDIDNAYAFVKHDRKKILSTKNKTWKWNELIKYVLNMMKEKGVKLYIILV